VTKSVVITGYYRSILLNSNVDRMREHFRLHVEKMCSSGYPYHFIQSVRKPIPERKFLYLSRVIERIADKRQYLETLNDDEDTFAFSARKKKQRKNSNDTIRDDMRKKKNNNSINNSNNHKEENKKEEKKQEKESTEEEKEKDCLWFKNVFHSNADISHTFLPTIQESFETTGAQKPCIRIVQKRVRNLGEILNHRKSFSTNHLVCTHLPEITTFLFFFCKICIVGKTFVPATSKTTLLQASTITSNKNQKSLRQL
jgi:hypothetical protein